MHYTVDSELGRAPDVCPACGRHRAPSPTVDVLILEADRGVVLVWRKNTPVGWALPGGFVDYGETVEHAAVREAKEETGLDITLTGLVGVYSDPARDPRGHTISTVFTAGTVDADSLAGGDDAEKAAFFPLGSLPDNLMFDHRKIIDDFMRKGTVPL